MSFLRPTASRAVALASRQSLLPSARFASTTAAPITVISSSSNASGSLLGNIEASWTSLPVEEQGEVFQKLAEIQKKNWKELTIDEKKAAYYVAYGPHGPRTPLSGPNHGMKVFVGTGAAIATAIGTFLYIRSTAPPPPKSMSKEWQEASTAAAREANINPITGISSEGYKGKGFVSS